MATAARGPVHLNLPFREPLLGTAGELPPVVDRWSAEPATLVDDAVLSAVADACWGERGLIVTGGFEPQLDVRVLSDATGWPILSDPRNRRAHANAVSTFDGLLRYAGFADRHRPDVVVRFGPGPASRILGEWLQGSGARQVQVRWGDTWLDPRLDVGIMVRADPGPLCEALVGRLPKADASWTESWRRAETAAQRAIDAVMPPGSEPEVARRLLRILPRPSNLVVASSMPIRDIEWYTEPTDGIAIHANRGANGIDGTISTAIGVALAQPEVPTTLLIGDVAFLHDQTALVGLMARDLDLTIVVVDNDGGAIFSFLPQRGALPDDRYEQLFGTPHGTDIPALAAAYGLPLASLEDCARPGGTRLVHIRSDRATNVVVHAALNQAIAAAAEGHLN